MNIHHQEEPKWKWIVSPAGKYCEKCQRKSVDWTHVLAPVNKEGEPDVNQAVCPRCRQQLRRIQ